MDFVGTPDKLSLLLFVRYIFPVMPFLPVFIFILSALVCVGSTAPRGSASSFYIPVISSNSSGWIALNTKTGPGSSIVSPDQLRREKGKGARVFLPFSADTLIEVQGGVLRRAWIFEDYRWQMVDPVWLLDTEEVGRWSVSSGSEEAKGVIWFDEAADGSLATLNPFVVRSDADGYLPYFFASEVDGWERRGRYGEPDDKPVIYQMLPRLVGNTNETRKTNGTLKENGTGTFSDLSEGVLERLREDGFTHLWVTGVFQQATSTDYTEIGQPADDPDLLKGIAGSPYAIKDYFDVSPDYADNPANRIEEFRALLGRAEDADVRIVIDLVANHVARSYYSDIRPDLSFGEGDRVDRFFDPTNNFFYLNRNVVAEDPVAPLILPTVDPRTREVVGPTARRVGGADGAYAPEDRVVRVTGNNVVSARPSIGDWYETVKLNYGFNFLDPEAAPFHPSAVTPKLPIPDTWKKMDEIVAYWQEMGVDGFRADMAHMIPPEFWKWVISRARERDAGVFFFGEAYDDDPAKVPSRDPALRPDDGVMISLLDAGFGAVYDDPGYDTLEHLYEGRAWANDLDREEMALGPFFFDCAVRYAENHDEIRLAHPGTWGQLGPGVGRPVVGALFGFSRGPVMVYNGQMVGETGEGVEGFGGDDARTTIFDYWSMPAFNQWWNDGAIDGKFLSDQAIALRQWYVKLLSLLQQPAFTGGNFYALNAANADNPFYGRIDEPYHSGRWFYSYIRYDPATRNRFLVVVNFHPTMAARHVRIRFTGELMDEVGLAGRGGDFFIWRDRLDDFEVAQSVSRTLREGMYIEEMPPLSVRYLEWTEEDVIPTDAIVPPFASAGDVRLGAVPILRVRPGEIREIDLRRFGNPGKTHRFALGDTGGLETVLDSINLRLTIRVPDEATGLIPVQLRLVPAGEAGEVMDTWIPIAVEALPMAEFLWNGGDEARSVSLVGDFNNWNAGVNPMVRVNDAWVAKLSLRPGTYRYKLVVDGEYCPDPSNQNRESDGFGGENSVLMVGGELEQNIPRPWAVRKDEDSVWFRVGGDRSGLTVYTDAIVEGEGSQRLSHEIIGDLIRVDREDVQNGALVRLVVANSQGIIGPAAVAFAGDPEHDLWQDDIIYYAFTDRFIDADPTNNVPINHPDLAFQANYQGGDFQGITAKVREGYFEKLGVNVLWLAPLNRNPDTAWQEYLPPYRYYSGYHGYWPIESRGIEPRFGGESALRELVDTSHGEGLKIIADLVLKHVHSEHPLWTERPDLFGSLEASDGSRNLRRWDDAPFTTWFEPFLPAFDFQNPEAVERQIDESLYWLKDYGFDGYRLDAVKHIRPDFWWRFRGRIEEAFPENNFYFVGETFGNRESILSFVGPNMLDGQFDFPLYDVLMEVFAARTRGFGALEEALHASESVYGKITLMSPLLGNHDKERFMAVADGDLPDPTEPDAEEVGWARPPEVDDHSSYEKLRMAMTFLLSIDGAPMIYYGDEVGLTGAGDPDNRRMMPMEEELSVEQKRVREHFSRLAKARSVHPALFLGSRRPLIVEEDQYAFVRAHLDDRAVVLFNQSDRPYRFSLDLSPEIDKGELVSVLDSRTLTVRGGKAVITLPPHSSALFVTRN